MYPRRAKNLSQTSNMFHTKIYNQQTNKTEDDLKKLIEKLAINIKLKYNNLFEFFTNMSNSMRTQGFFLARFYSRNSAMFPIPKSILFSQNVAKKIPISKKKKKNFFFF